MNWDSVKGLNLISNKGDLETIVETINRVAYESSKHPEIVKLSQRFKGSNPEEDIFRFVYDQILYRKDWEDQIVQYAHKSIEKKTGNCVSYSVLISAILQNLGVKHYFRVIDETGEGFSHIYIITDKGIVLDPVIGQRQDDTDSFKNRNGGFFNSEVTYKNKKDIMPKVYTLGNTHQRIQAVSQQFQLDPSGAVIPEPLVHYINSKNLSRRVQRGVIDAVNNGSYIGILNGDDDDFWEGFDEPIGNGEGDGWVEAAIDVGEWIAKNWDSCKRGCDFDYPFNKEKRQMCKCRCAQGAEGSDYSVDCFNEYGIPKIVSNIIIPAQAVQYFSKGDDGYLSMRLRNPSGMWRDPDYMLIGRSTLPGLNGRYYIRKRDTKDGVPTWITFSKKVPANMTFTNGSWRDGVTVAMPIPKGAKIVPPGTGSGADQSTPSGGSTGGGSTSGGYLPGYGQNITKTSKAEAGKLGLPLLAILALTQL